MKAFSVEDLHLHCKVMELHGRIRGSAVFGTVRSVNRKDNRYTQRIWRFPCDGADPQQVTQGPGDDTSARLSPDGTRLAFLSTRSASSQIHLLDLRGGEASQVGQFDSGVSDFKWAPDGKSLFVTAAVPVDPDARGNASAQSPGPRDESAPEVCWKLPYKSDDAGYLLSREIHLHSLDIATGQIRRLTRGPFDVLGFDASPNGKHLAYVRTRDGKFAHLTDLWVCDLDGSRHRRLTTTLSTVVGPSWSSDGTRLAFAGSVKQGDGESRLWLLTYPSGEPHCIDDDLEVADPQNLFWNADDDTLTLVRAWHGRHQVVEVDVRSSKVQVLIGGDRQLSAFARFEGGFAYAVDVPTRPSEVYVCRGDKEHRVGTLNPWWTNRVQLTLEARRFDVPDGKGGTESIEGWLLRKKGSQGPQPLLVDVHGGPASYALLDFDSNVFWQALCSRDWAILMLNAVGSSSYGSEFCARLSGHWGEMDLPQYLAAVAALRQEGVCDERVALAGKSYGGYLTSWAIGHTDVFRSAVVMAPVGNIETHYGTSDGGYYADPLYIGTAPEFDRHKARELSPLQFVEKASTPTLFLQGKEDERCPKCQSEELFVSLYNAGNTTCELVLYPNEGHSFLGQGKPACRVDAATRIVEWVCRHTTADTPVAHKEVAHA